MGRRATVASGMRRPIAISSWYDLVNRCTRSPRPVVGSPPTMNVQTAAAVGAALVSLAFAMSTFERWLARHRRHELAWSTALLMFALASAALAAGAAGGWNGPVFRLFFFFGAIANVPFLALGTIYLLAVPRTGDRWAAVITLLTAFATGVVVVAPFTGAIPTHQLPQGSDVFGPLPRILAATASGAGAVVVIGGAVWSAFRRRLVA